MNAVSSCAHADLDDCTPQTAGSGSPDRIAQIKGAVAEAWGLPCLDLDSRRKSDALARQVAMFVAREVAGISLRAVARAFERDPATVLFGCRQVAGLVQRDDGLAAKIALFEQEFGPLQNGNAGRSTREPGLSVPAKADLPAQPTMGTPQQVLSECRARGEQRVGSGQTRSGSLIHLLVAPGGRWTLVETQPARARIIASGARWSESETKPSPSEPSRRVCLKCGQEFRSSGAGNRLCPRCLRTSRANSSSIG